MLLRALLAVTGLACLLAPARGEAAQFDVAPVRLELSASQPSALLTIRNTAKAPIRLQLRGHAWEQSPSGEMLLKDNAEVVIFPALLQIDPGGERKVRVGTTTAPGLQERTWRVFLEEMPSATESSDRSAVRVLTRVGIPVFLAPIRPQPRAEIGLGAVGGKIAIRLRNTGNVHLEPGSGRLLLFGAAGESLAERDLKIWYVLASGERAMEEAVGESICAQVRRAVASFPLEKGEVTADLALPTGACGG